MADPNELMTSQETAKLIGIANNTLEIWRVQGKGPKFVKLGTQNQSAVRYRRGDVIAFIEERLHQSTSSVARYSATLATLRGSVNGTSDASA